MKRPKVYKKLTCSSIFDQPDCLQSRLNRLKKAQQHKQVICVVRRRKGERARGEARRGRGTETETEGRREGE